MGSPSGYNKRREMDVMKLCEPLGHVHGIATVSVFAASSTEGAFAG